MHQVEVMSKKKGSVIVPRKTKDVCVCVCVCVLFQMGLGGLFCAKKVVALHHIRLEDWWQRVGGLHQNNGLVLRQMSGGSMGF